MVSIFISNRISLREIKRSDQGYIFNGLSNPEVIRYYGVSFVTYEATREQMDWYESLVAKGEGRWWAIVDPKNETFFGAIGLNHLQKIHRKAEIGYWLLPQYWGKGIIKEVIPFIIEYGFRNFGLHRIEALVETGNTGSAKILTQAGFNYEGTMVDCEIKNGNFISLEIYSKLNPLSDFNLT
jgi:[ribosomal protein S5]-alanine N-acetyltransferase